jgi:hypothetical protein
MSNFYDPWAHAAQLFFARVIQFFVLSVLFGSIIWAALLHWGFDASWADVARSTWTIVSTTTNLHWLVLLDFCVLVGVLLSAWLFTTVTLLSRLQSGDRHHRGPRVIKHVQD